MTTLLPATSRTSTTTSKLASTLKKVTFAAAALVGLLGAPQQADAGIKYTAGIGGEVDTRDPDVLKQQAKIQEELDRLAAEKKDELKQANTCENSDGVWVYDANPAHMGYCLPTNNRINDCNLDNGVWIYGVVSSYPALDIALHNGQPILGGEGGTCWRPTIVAPSMPSVPTPVSATPGVGSAFYHPDVLDTYCAYPGAVGCSGTGSYKVVVIDYSPQVNTGWQPMGQCQYAGSCFGY
jgi:hypothetical protein